jgi:hypothetical protein
MGLTGSLGGMHVWGDELRGLCPLDLSHLNLKCRPALALLSSVACLIPPGNSGVSKAAANTPHLRISWVDDDIPLRTHAGGSYTIIPMLRYQICLHRNRQDGE